MFDTECQSLDWFCLLQNVGVSAVTGEGIDTFFSLVDEAAMEYEK